KQANGSQATPFLDRGGGLPAGGPGAGSAGGPKKQTAPRKAPRFRPPRKTRRPLPPPFNFPESLPCPPRPGGGAARRLRSALVARLSRRRPPLDADYGRTDKARCDARP